jgi:hypothetical protein
MDIKKLKNALEPWLKVSTWNTYHPLDDERFHKALKSAFDTLGTTISFDDFKEAMDQLAANLHPGMNQSYRDELIYGFAKRAEQIGSYLHDNGM